MNFLDFFIGVFPMRFVTKKQYKKNLQDQRITDLQTLQVLRQYNVTEDTQLALEFFFYTNTYEKASRLTKELAALQYDVSCGESPEVEASEFVITGWTTKMKMDEKTVVTWTDTMVMLGYRHDAAFDGWGTNPV